LKQIYCSYSHTHKRNSEWFSKSSAIIFEVNVAAAQKQA